VRPHTLTAGLVQDSRTSLDLATLLIADARMPREDLTPGQRQLLELCLQGRLSVAEASAYLALTGQAVKLLAASLLNGGHLIAKHPIPAARRHDVEILEAVLSGLRALPDTRP
jgi:hypothetical protein